MLSHQGRREYGSPAEPATAEALALSFIDDLDSKLNQVRGARRSAAGARVVFVRGLGRSVVLATPGGEDGTG